MNYSIARILQVDVPFKKVICKDFPVTEDETVGQLRMKVEKKLHISNPRGTALLQDGKELSDDAKLNEAKIDVKMPVVFARR